MPRANVNEVQAKQVLNRVKNMPFAWSLNPYRGCTHGCSFCYARGTHTYIGLEANDSFRTDILVKSNAPDVLERELETLARRHNWNLTQMSRTIGTVAVGTATDPYQPIEAKARITRACLEVLSRYQVHTSITTRSPLILQDVDILKRMNLESVNISINTLNPKVWKGLEPASPAPIKRLEIVRQLREHDLPAGVFLAPIIPHITDSTSELSALLDAAQKNQTLFVMPSVLRLADDMKGWFFSWIQESFPEAERPLTHLYRNGYPPRAYVEVKLGRIRLLMSRMGLRESLDSAWRLERRAESGTPWQRQAVLPI